MKKLFIMLVVLFTINLASNAQTLFFHGQFKGNDFTQSNGINEKETNHKKVFLLIDYNSTTMTFSSSATMIYYWRDKDSKLGRQKTETITPTAFQTLISGKTKMIFQINNYQSTKKEYFVLLSTRFQQKGDTGFVPVKLSGARVYEITNDLGERTTGSAAISFKIAKNAASKGDAAGIESWLEGRGYRKTM